MSSYAPTASTAHGPIAVESKTAAVTSKRSKESSASAVRTWAWGKAREPYDWMDAHTPCDDLDSWR